MGVAFVIWILDFTRFVCAPESWVQGHAAWHILGAVAAWYLFRYYSISREVPARDAGIRSQDGLVMGVHRHRLNLVEFG